MARGVNKVILVGNLGQDPETRAMPSGKAVTNVRIATSESWKDKQTGEQKEQTEWHTIVFFDRLAEIASEYLRKGSQIYVEGRLRTRKWQDQSGTDRYTTEINVGVGGVLTMLDGAPGGGACVRGKRAVRPDPPLADPGHQFQPPERELKALVEGPKLLLDARGGPYLARERYGYGLKADV